MKLLFKKFKAIRNDIYICDKKLFSLQYVVAPNGELVSHEIKPRYAITDRRQLVDMLKAFDELERHLERTFGFEIIRHDELAKKLLNFEINADVVSRVVNDEIIPLETIKERFYVVGHDLRFQPMRINNPENVKKWIRATKNK